MERTVRKKKLGGYPGIGVVVSIVLALFVIGLFGVLVIYSRELENLVRRLMDDFIQVLRALASPVQNHDVHLVETAGTLVEADWANEMHPTRDGFQKLAERFRPLLRQWIPGTP